jgi:hypothetical protein
MSDAPPPSPYHSTGEYLSELTTLTPYSAGYVEDLYVSVYSLSVDDTGRAFVSAEAIGRRCVLSEVSSQQAILCDTVPSGDATTVESICEGYYADWARQALLNWLGDARVKAGQYELRWLTAPEFLIESVWLKSASSDLPDLIGPVFHHEAALEGKSTLPMDEFTTLVESVARNRLASKKRLNNV